jgi:hypothetical protein
VTWTYTFQARNRLGKLPLTLFVKTQWKGDTDVCLKNIFVATTRRWHTFPSTLGAMWSEMLRSLGRFRSLVVLAVAPLVGSLCV